MPPALMPGALRIESDRRNPPQRNGATCSPGTPSSALQPGRGDRAEDPASHRGCRLPPITGGTDAPNVTSRWTPPAPRIPSMRLAASPPAPLQGPRAAVAGEASRPTAVDQRPHPDRDPGAQATTTTGRGADPRSVGVRPAPPASPKALGVALAPPRSGPERRVPASRAGSPAMTTATQGDGRAVEPRVPSAASGPAIVRLQQAASAALAQTPGMSPSPTLTASTDPAPQRAKEAYMATLDAIAATGSTPHHPSAR